MGTSIACSATTGSVTKNLTTSANWSTICGTGTSIIGTGTKDSMIGSTVRRRTRQPPQAEVAADPRRVYHQRRQRTRPPLAVFWPRGTLNCTCSTNSSFNGTVRHAEWWSFSARAIATLIRSCRSNERRRRSLLRLAEPVVTRGDANKGTLESNSLVVVVVVVLLVVVRTVRACLSIRARGMQ